MEKVKFRTHEEFQEEIRKAKVDLNLPSYILSLNEGWELNKEKSRPDFTFLQKEEGGHTIDIISCFKSKSGDYLYATLNDKTDKGTIIDFEKNKRGIDPKDNWNEFFKRTNQFLGTSENAKLPTQALSDKEIEKKIGQNNEKSLGLLPLQNTRYLEGRGITAAAYESPEFKGKVFNNRYFTKPNEFYTNTVFPIQNEVGFVSSIIRNDQREGYRGEQYNKFSEKRVDAVHVSNLPEKGTHLDKLYIAESPIDALSHFELNQKRLRENNEKVAYISTGGRPSNSSYNNIQSIINQTSPKEIITIMDNDNAGRRFSAEMIGRWSIPNNAQSHAVRADIDVSQRIDGRLNLEVFHQNEKEKEAIQEKIKAIIIEPLNKNITEGSKAEIKVSTVKSSENSSHFEVAFLVDKKNLEIVERGLIELKGMEQNFKLEHPKQKDFNDELKRTKPFVVTSHQEVKAASKISELPQKRFDNSIDAFVFAKDLPNAHIYFEKYNVSHEVEKPQLLAKLENGQTKEINQGYQADLDKDLAKKEAEKALKDQKILAIELAKRMFPENDVVLVENKKLENGSTIFNFQSIESQPLRLNSDYLDKNYQEKINMNQDRFDKFFITFKENSSLLTVQGYGQSTQIDENWVEKGKNYVKDMSENEKVESLKNEVNQNELKLVDRKGETIAVADYRIEIRESGGYEIKRVEEFDSEKMLQDGLDSMRVKETLVHESCPNAEQKFDIKPSEKSLEVGQVVGLGMER